LSILAEREPKRVLVLGAHADDIEIGCGGTLLRLVAEHPGIQVLWVVFCAAGVRDAEAHAAAHAFLDGVANPVLLIRSHRDGYLPYSGPAVKDEFEAIKAQFEPDLIFTHYRHDLHQDHRLISELTWNTWRSHLVLEYEIPKYDGDLGTPNFFGELTRSVLDRKVALILEHYRSQAGRHWFTRDLFTAVARIRGMECVAAEGFAEGFYCRKATF
jgi:LmbE family N-acetylglucosaminyl deacetylase